MALDADGIIIAGTGHIYVAPVGTTLPETYDDTLDTAFEELGFTDEDGFLFRDGKGTRPSKVWQSFFAQRYSVTDRTAECEMALKEFNDITLSFALGATVTSDGGDGAIITPPDPETLDERALVADVVDGTKIIRFVYPRGLVIGNVESRFNRNDDSLLPITFGAIGAEGEDIYTILTNVAVPAGS